jgi:uncharacterized protein (TIGR02145 family)
MVDIRGFNGGMNTDAAPELLPSGDYTYAMNISNGSEGITNLLGNRLLPGMPENSFPGTEWICGAFFDKVRQRIIYFTNHSGGVHRIICYNVPNILNESGSYVVLFEDTNGVFSYWDSLSIYNPEALIKDIKVIHREYEGDLYYFIDPKKKLLKFNYNTILGWSANDTTLCAFGWTSANYDGITLNDGTPIIQVQSPSDWAGLTVPAWCYYDNNTSNGNTYGKLYNWYAASHPLFAPIGYRVPTDTDWTNLINCLGGQSIAGGKMKSTSLLWTAPNTGATNESLFNGLPGGSRSFNGQFSNIGSTGNWWSSAEFNDTTAMYRFLVNSSTNMFSGNINKKSGLSIRLIKVS